MAQKLIIHNRTSSLLPKESYSQEFKKNLFEYGGKKDLSENLIVIEDKVSADIINVWSIEKEELDRLKKEYGNAKFTHSSTGFIRSCLELSSEGIFYNKLRNGIEVLVINNQGIQLYTSLFGSESQDLLYYILLYQDRFGKNLNVYLSNQFDKNSITLVSDYIADIRKMSVSSTKLVESNHPHYTLLK